MKKKVRLLMPAVHAQPTRKMEVDLEEALDIVGLGWCNVSHSALLLGFLVAAMLEMAGYSFVIPEARCDLIMSDAMQGFITSIPNIAIVLTAHTWGYVADKYGRKKTLMFTSLGSGTLAAAAAFMPDVTSYAICKFLASLFLSCPSSLSFAYVGELLPRRHRDVAVLLVNALQTAGSTLIPLLAWGILSLDFRLPLGLFDFRPWRLLVLVYALPLVILACLLVTTPESPKFLVSQGRCEEALMVLKEMYAKNNGLTPEDFPVSNLKVDLSSSQVEAAPGLLASLRQQTSPLLKPPLLKWLALNGFLMFGVFSMLNGLYMWVPDAINRMLSDPGAGTTACDVIQRGLNESSLRGTGCSSQLGGGAFAVAAGATAACSLLALAAGAAVPRLGKRPVLLLTYLATAVACLLALLVPNLLLAAVMLVALQLTAIAIGPINAYVVHIFPTELRGMAVGLVMMFGRIGSVFGANVGGVLLNAACPAAFYSFGTLMLVCGLLCLLLPRTN